jgi:hypothetical protein
MFCQMYDEASNAMAAEEPENAYFVLYTAEMYFIRDGTWVTTHYISHFPCPGLSWPTMRGTGRRGALCLACSVLRCAPIWLATPPDCLPVRLPYTRAVFSSCLHGRRRPPLPPVLRLGRRRAPPAHGMGARVLSGRDMQGR